MKRLVITVVIVTALASIECAPSRSSRASRAATLPPSIIRQSELSDELTTTESAGTTTTTTTPRPSTSRKNKALNLFGGFFPSFFSSDLDYGEDDDDFTFEVNNENSDGEDLSRTIPARRRNQNQNKKKNNNYINDNLNSVQYENSPIFYIRIPPTPYMFVPGLGYVSQPPTFGPPMAQPSPSVDPFINVPIEFVSNGKPTNVYQWPGAYGPPPVDPYGYGAPPPPPPINYSPYAKPQQPQKKPSYDSKVTSLKGTYMFNGKPNDKVFVLRDSYNSLYADALQNFYP